MGYGAADWTVKAVAQVVEQVVIEPEGQRFSPHFL